MATVSIDTLPPSGKEFRDQGNRLAEEEIARTMEVYATELASRTLGPQLEGIEHEHLEQALRTDPNLVLLEIEQASGERVKWPLFVPIEHHIDYSKAFFDEHYPGQPAYALILPPLDALEGVRFSEEFSAIAKRLRGEQAVISYDYLVGTDAGLLQSEFLREVLGKTTSLEDVTPESVWGDRAYGLPKVAHFEGFVEPVNRLDAEPISMQEALRQKVERGELSEYPKPGVAYLSPDMLAKDDGVLMQQIWDIYSDQFDMLTEDHPSLQKQPREELERMLLGDDAVNIAYIEDGKITGLLYFVHDIGNCVWLNKKFYDERYADSNKWLSYYPGVVVAKEKAQKGAGYVQAMMACLADCIEATGQGMILTCQCTNISMTYIPKIAARVIEDNPTIAMIHDKNGDAFTKMAEYEYRILKLQ